MLRGRLLGTLLTALVLVGLLSSAAAAAATAGHQLAVAQPTGQPAAAGDEQPLPGPEPDPRTTFAPEQYEPPWTWWLGVILTGVTVVGVAAAGLGYWLLIARPRQRAGR